MPNPTFEDVRAQAYRELGDLLDRLRSNRPAYAAMPAPASEQLDAVRDARRHIVAAREALNNAAG